MSERHTTFPSALEAFFLVLCLWGLEYLMVCALYDARAWLGLGDPLSQGVLAVVLGNGILFTALLHWKNLDYRDLFNASRSATAATVLLLVPLVLLATPLLMLAMIGLNQALEALFPMSANMKEQMRQMSGAGLPQVLLVCVLAPVLEEMLFRGIILRSFLQQYERGYAILGSAVVFGFAHGNIYQLVYATIFGIAAGWLYERTRSLIPGIALHGAVNSGGALWLAYAGPDAGLPDAATWAVLALPALPACYILRRFLAAPGR